jgi:uncharacterized membrane protein
VKHASRAVSLGVVLACVVATMSLGIAAKTPCANGAWADNVQYRLLCYSDVVPLVVTEQLQGGRLPYLDPCAPSEHNCDEYPVVSMYVMRVAAWVSGLAPGAGPYAPFFFVNAAILMACAVLTAWGLWALVGRRALWFALAPSLLLTGTVNWDLLAVALSTWALVAYAARREEWTGVAIGAGAATKFFPAFVLVPLMVQGVHDRQPDRSVRILWWTAGSWLALNLPFAITAWDGWTEFFTFNAARPPDFDSAWYIVADIWPSATLPVGTVNIAAAVLFVAGVALCWWLKARVPGRLQPWTLVFPMVVVFLLTSKVYSPQYDLWLLPLFVLCLPRLWTFVLFQVTDVAVYVTRFRFFGSFVGEPWGWPERWFQTAIGARWVVLVVSLIVWIRSVDEPLLLRFGTRARSPVAAAEAAPA